MKLLRLHGCTHSYHNRIVSHSYFIAIKARPIRFLGHLVGGFNPFEKYSSKWAHLPQFSGWKYWSIGNHLLDEQFMSVEHPNHPGTFWCQETRKRSWAPYEMPPLEGIPQLLALVWVKPVELGAVPTGSYPAQSLTVRPWKGQPYQ